MIATSTVIIKLLRNDQFANIQDRTSVLLKFTLTEFRGGGYYNYYSKESRTGRGASLGEEIFKRPSAIGTGMEKYE